MSLLVPAAVGALVMLAALLSQRPAGVPWALRRIESHVHAAPPRTAGQPSRIERLLLRELEAAGSRLGPHRLVLLTIGAGAATALLLHQPAGAAVGAALPHVVLRIRARRRARAFERRLPDLLDTLAASLRVGHGFEQALRGVAEEADEPAASELRRALGEIRLGRSTADALGDAGHRLGSADLPFVLSAIEIQQQVGGNLAGLLASVAKTVRAREQFRRRVRALTSMGRASAVALTCLPFVAGFALSAIRPGYMHPLWATHTGRLLVAGAGLALVLGALLLRRIVEVKA